MSLSESDLAGSSDESSKSEGEGARLPPRHSTLSRSEVKNLIDQGLVSRSTICKFDYLHKGEWTYILPVGDTWYKIRGGEATYEAAYDLELSSEEPLDNLIYSVHN